MQGYKFTGLTDFDFLTCNELGTASGVRAKMHMLDCSFPEANLIWPHSTRKVPCGIAIFR